MTWPTKKLSELLETCDAGTWGKPAPKGKGLFVLRSTNITNGGSIDFTDVAELDIRDKVEKLKLLNGDILLEKSGGGPDQPVGRVVYFMTPSSRVYTFANFIQRLRANSKFIDSHFLFYRLFFLHKIGFTKKLQSQTTGIRNLKMSLYLKTEIPIPPLATQKQIVARLDKIAEAQKLNSELIQKTDELFQSLLHQELNPAGKNWETKKLGEVAKINYGKGLLKPEKTDDGKYFAYGSNGPVYRTNKILVDKPTIVVGRKGTAGALYFVSEPSWPIDTTFYLETSKIVDLNFLFYSLQTKNLSKLAIVTAVPGINRNNLGRVKIAIPPLKIQKQIVAKLSAVQEYKTQLLAQKSKLKELFDSALAKSFNG